jgi:acyl dehydratase
VSTDDDGNLITAEMRAFVGTTKPAADLPEEISASDVRRFLSVTGETNPIYRDDASARACGYRRRVVPPMLVVQLFRRVDEPEGDGAESGGSDWPGLPLPPAYTNTRNAGHEFTWLRPVYVGDRLTVQQRLTDMYVRRGRAGIPVIYLVRETEIRNQAGEPVVRQVSMTAKLPESSVAPTK